MNEINNHLYTVELSSGTVRMREREVFAVLGPEAFESEYVDHSHWCECNALAVDDNPPF